MYRTRYVLNLSGVAVALSLVMMRAAPVWSQEAQPVAASTAATTEQRERDCSALANTNFSWIPDAPTQIISAVPVKAKGDVRSHCRVTGYVATHVGIGMQMPLVHWNGKFVEAGCGGNCGSLWWTSCNDPLRRGYACIVSDTGHTSTALDSLWAYNDLAARIDFGYRATHVAALAGKALAERYYSKAPGRSYFIGCSQGGRQGLVEAQRFPWDFDGIVAGAPPLNVTGHWLHVLWRRRQLLDAQGQLNLTHDQVQRVHQAALAACDLDDGVRDGVIGNPAACRFDPGVLLCKNGQRQGCLTADQLDTARSIYSDAKTRFGEYIYRGELPGTELRWEHWTGVNVEQRFRYQAFWPDPGPRWQASDIDFDRDLKRTGMMDALYDATNPDLRRFKAAGGKLLLYHGWNDEIVSPLNTVDYYETVERTLGGREATADFLRLFMVPGLNHCSGGDGAFKVDWLSYLEAWVEKSHAPDELLSAHVNLEDVSEAAQRGDDDARQKLMRLLSFPLDPATVEFFRPLYPYPAVAAYRGRGDSRDAANWKPVFPRAH